MGIEPQGPLKPESSSPISYHSSVHSFGSFRDFFSKEVGDESSSFVKVGDHSYKVSESPAPQPAGSDEPEPILVPNAIQHFQLIPLFDGGVHIHAVQSHNMHLLIADIIQALDTMVIQKSGSKYVFDISSLPLRIEFDRYSTKTVISIKVFDADLFKEFSDSRHVLAQSIKKEADLFDFDLNVEYLESKSDDDQNDGSSDESSDQREQKETS